MQLADFKYIFLATLAYLPCKTKRVVNITAINASCQQRTESLKTDGFQILSSDILQLSNVILLVDWQRENDFLQF